MSELSCLKDLVREFYENLNARAPSDVSFFMEYRAMLDTYVNLANYVFYFADRIDVANDDPEKNKGVKERHAEIEKILSIYLELDNQSRIPLAKRFGIVLAKSVICFLDSTCHYKEIYRPSKETNLALQ